MPAPVFLCPHTEHQFDIREPVGFVFVLCIFPCEAIVRLSCVLYFLMVEKAESSFGASPVGVEYIRTVSLCSPLISFRFSIRRFALRLVPPSRLGVSCHTAMLCVSPYVSLGVSSLVSSFVSSLRFAFHACQWAMAFDMGAVSPCLPLVLSCRVVACRSAFRSSSRPASRVSSCHASCLACRFVRLVMPSRPAFRFHCLS